MVGLTLVSAATTFASTPQTARQEAERLARLAPLVPNGRVDHSGPNAAGASGTLSFGTMARVTNLSNGRSTLVTVEDSGPSVVGRVMDVTPKVAERLGMRTGGVAPVLVAPITVPQEDGTMKLGAGVVSTAAGGRPGRAALSVR